MLWIRVAILSACFASGWLVNGWRLGESIEKANREQAESVIEAERLSREVAAAISEKNAAEQMANDAKATIITKEVIKYVQSPSAGNCKLPDKWLYIHNQAAVPVIPNTRSVINDATAKTSVNGGESGL